SAWNSLQGIELPTPQSAKSLRTPRELRNSGSPGGFDGTGRDNAGRPQRGDRRRLPVARRGLRPREALPPVELDAGFAAGLVQLEVGGHAHEHRGAGVLVVLRRPVERVAEHDTECPLAVKVAEAHG